MKKTFLAKRNALLSSANISWGVYALLFSLVVLFVRLIAPNFFWTVFTPVFRVSDAFSETSHSFFNSFGDTAALALENEKLTEKNGALALQNQALVQKVASLSGLAQDRKAIIAGVVARPPSSPYDTLVLAGGSNEGIALGMEAFAMPAGRQGEGGTPLGVVSSVLANFSRITLFSTSGVTTNGWIGQKNLPITLRGVGAGAMSASVARSAGITIGDIVSVPGPGQLPIGSVTRIDSDPTSSSITLRIMPVLNLFSTAWVTLRDTGVTRFTFATSSSL